jgi:hypothetical protein
MEWAALIAWVITALFGFTMLVIWLRRGGMRQREMGRIRPALILSHFALAAGGLVVWIVYVASDTEALAWIAFGALVVVALLGWTMFFIWLKQRQTTAQPAVAPTGGSAEQGFPVPVVALHGLAAVTTVVLVLLAALGVGGD